MIRPGNRPQFTRVAWDRERTRIVAHAAQIDEALDLAIAAGHPDAILQKVRHPQTVYTGTA